VRQIKSKEIGFLLKPANDDQSFAKISLRMARRMIQRHKHLFAAALLAANVILHNRIAAGEPAFGPQPVKYPLGRVTLLARTPLVLRKPDINLIRKPIQLGPLDRGCATISPFSGM